MKLVYILIASITSITAFAGYSPMGDFSTLHEKLMQNQSQYTQELTRSENIQANLTELSENIIHELWPDRTMNRSDIEMIKNVVFFHLITKENIKHNEEQIPKQIYFSTAWNEILKRVQKPDQANFACASKMTRALVKNFDETRRQHELKEISETDEVIFPKKPITLNENLVDPQDSSEHEMERLKKLGFTYDKVSVPYRQNCSYGGDFAFYFRPAEGKKIGELSDPEKKQLITEISKRIFNKLCPKELVTDENIATIKKILFHKYIIDSNRLSNETNFSSQIYSPTAWNEILKHVQKSDQANFARASKMTSLLAKNFHESKKLYDFKRASQSKKISFPEQKLSEVLNRNPVDPQNPVESETKLLRELGLTRGIIQVPLNWDHPDGPTTTVAFYFRPAEGKKLEEGTPLVYFNGGPAASSFSNAYGFETSPQFEYLKQFPMVYIDQRGTGFSQKKPSFIGVTDTQTYFGTRGIVLDAEAIRRVLFGQEKKWKILGASYGSFIVHRYVELMPEGIHSAYAHVNALQSRPLEMIKQRLVKQQRLLADHPELVKKMDRIFREFKNFKQTLRYPHGTAVFDYPYVRIQYGIGSIEENFVRYPFDQMFGFHSNTFQNFEKTLDQFIRNDGSVDIEKFALLLLKYINNNSNLRTPSTEIPLGQVMTELEQFPGLNSFEAKEKAISELKSDGHQPEDWLLSEYRTSAPAPKYFQKIYRQDPFSLEKVAKQLRAHPELRFYLYSGGKDLLVPSELFSEETKYLGNRITYRYFPEADHGTTLIQKEAITDLENN